MSDLVIPWSRWEASGRVGARAQVQDVRLYSLKTQLKEFGADPPYTVDLEVDATAQRDDDANFFVISAEYTLKTNAYGEEQDAHDDAVEAEIEVAEVSFTLLALYGLGEPADDDEPLSTDELEAYAESVGVMTLHPYARELIQDQTTRLGLPGLTIGVAKIVR
ncbi:hypothetical protein [Humibacillus xanthopallidus]|uniref:hypothetical protein n=1 Tax=Humibacillus xanthopallidus TaxID=412689 RepID=UPI00384CF1CC